MMYAPRFWQNSNATVFSRLLAPASAFVAFCAGRRQKQSGWKAPVPVLCCGNITVGGTGKTTVALDIIQRLQQRGVAVHALIRGYGGNVKNTTRVEVTKHTAQDVGDEALLLAAKCPTWVGGDRVASAKAAIQAGAQFLVMDDGFQNPGLSKDVSLVVIDGAVGLGNGCVLPAGPLRETSQNAFERASAFLLVGEDQAGFMRQYGEQLSPKTVLRADLQPISADIDVLKSSTCVAFAGLGRPSKFFDGLKKAGVPVVAAVAFPDHYFYKTKDMNKLLALSTQHHGQLITTPKDAARLPPSMRAHIKTVGVGLEWENSAEIENMLSELLTKYHIL